MDLHGAGNRRLETCFQEDSSIFSPVFHSKSCRVSEVHGEGSPPDSQTKMSESELGLTGIGTGKRKRLFFFLLTLT